MVPETERARGVSVQVKPLLSKQALSEKGKGDVRISKALAEEEV